MSKIEGHPNLKRDDSNMAVINTDTSGLERAKMIKAKYQRQADEINTLKEQVNELREIITKWQEQ
tara:strand:+ start:116 stop:310 length:195 start_codon:yes stop_codon:yes gene_type:complete